MPSNQPRPGSPRLAARPGRSLDEVVAEWRKDPVFRETYDAVRLPGRIANQVTIARGDLGWSYAQLAAKSGLTVDAVKAIENGRQLPLDISTLRSLANALGITFTIGPDQRSADAD
jgi:ribosome-binding protein aMBF1 (putative translation factor)